MAITVRPIFVNDASGVEFPYVEEISSPDCDYIQYILQNNFDDAYIDCQESERLGVFIINVEDTEDNKKKVINIFELNTLNLSYIPAFQPSTHVRFDIV